MAAVKIVLMILMVTLVMQSRLVFSQNCSANLGALTTCAAYVLPGGPQGPPSAECCGALRAVDRTCLCSTVDIINRIPRDCNLPVVTCDASFHFPLF